MWQPFTEDHQQFRKTVRESSAAKVLCLLVGNPALRPVALFGQGIPEDQDIDPGIATTGPGVAGHAGQSISLVPRPHPRRRKTTAPQ